MTSWLRSNCKRLPPKILTPEILNKGLNGAVGRETRMEELQEGTVNQFTETENERTIK
ncbi:MAG: hypothetical protein ACFFC7_12550 [Candidatus Hermodarchaeota archaeon]